MKTREKVIIISNNTSIVVFFLSLCLKRYLVHLIFCSAEISVEEPSKLKLTITKEKSEVGLNVVVVVVFEAVVNVVAVLLQLLKWRCQSLDGHRLANTPATGYTLTVLILYYTNCTNIIYHVVLQCYLML